MYSDSRYADGLFLQAVDARTGKSQITVFREFPSANISAHYYSWVEGDRIEVVASKLFGNSDMWWSIMDVNPDIIDPQNIAPGTSVRIPNV